MRPKRTLNRRVGEKEYHKWIIADVPPDTVQELGWQEGEELESVLKKAGLLVKKTDPKVERAAQRGRRK